MKHSNQAVCCNRDLTNQPDQSASEDSTRIQNQPKTFKSPSCSQQTIDNDRLDQNFDETKNAIDDEPTVDRTTSHDLNARATKRTAPNFVSCSFFGLQFGAAFRVFPLRRVFDAPQRRRQQRRRVEGRGGSGGAATAAATSASARSQRPTLFSGGDFWCSSTLDSTAIAHISDDNRRSTITRDTTRELGDTQNIWKAR